MADVIVKIKVEGDSNFAALDKGAASARKAADEFDRLTKVSGDTRQQLNSIPEGLDDFKAGIDVVTGVTGKVIEFGVELNRIGTAARSARESLDSLSGGQTDSYLKSMSASTNGLVSDFELSRLATKALTLGMVSNEQQMASLARSGSILGKVMSGDATAGVQGLLDVMKGADKAMMLDNIGISAVKVKARFEELKKSMDTDKAWSTAVLEAAAEKSKTLEGALDGAGTGVKRLETAFDNLKTQAGSNISYLIDQTLNLVDALNKASSGTNNTPGGKPGEPGVSGIPGGAMPNSADVIMLAQVLAAAEEKKQLDQKIASALGYQAMTPMAFAGQLLKGAFSKDNYISKLTQGEGTTFAPGYDSAYTGARTNDHEQAARDANRRAAEAERARRARGFLWAGDGQDQSPAIGGSVGGMAGPRNKTFDIANLSLVNDLFRMGKGVVEGYAGAVAAAVKPLSDMNAEIERRAKIQSVDQAFNVGPKDGLYAEVGGGMGSAVASARDKKQAELEKKFGKGTKKTAAGLDAFDAETKKAVDGYAIATGAATKESIAFRDQQGALDKAMASGSISAKEYAQSLLALAEAAKSGKNSVRDLAMVGLDNLINQTAGDKNINGKQKGAKNTMLMGETRYGEGADTNTKDVAAKSPMELTLDATKGKIDEVKSSMAGLPAAMGPLMDKSAGEVGKLTNAFGNANAQLEKMMRKQGNVRIIVESFFTASTPGGGGTESVPK